MKKVIAILLFFVLVFTVVSCDKKPGDIDFDEELIYQNIDDYVFPDKVNYLDYDSHEFMTDLISVDDSYLMYGILILQNSTGNGVYSVINDTMIVNFATTIVDIYFVSENYIGGYIFIEYSDGDFKVVDINGDTVLMKGNYNWFDVFVLRDVEYDDDGEKIQETYIETVNYMFDSGGTTQTIRNIINPDTQEREPYEDVSSYIPGDYFDAYETDKISLEDYGLEGYYTVDNDLLFIYNDADELINQIHIPQNIYSGFVFNDSLIYQTRMVVNDVELPFTYSDNGVLYLLNTYKVNILTGEKEKIEFSYLIDEFYEFKDSEGNITYAIIEAREIEDKYLVDTFDYELIIDSDLNVLMDISGYDIQNLRKLNDDTIINFSTDKVYDEDLNFVFELPSSYTILNEEELFLINYGGYYGLVNYNGIVQVPFEYDQIYTDFYNGYTIARIGLGDYFILSNDNDIVELNLNGFRMIGGGYGFVFRWDQLDQTFAVKMIEYGDSDYSYGSETTLKQYTTIEVYNVENIYSNHKVAVLETDDSFIFYLFEYEYEN